MLSLLSLLPLSSSVLLYDKDGDWPSPSGLGNELEEALLLAQGFSPQGRLSVSRLRREANVEMQDFTESQHLQEYMSPSNSDWLTACRLSLKTEGGLRTPSSTVREQLKEWKGIFSRSSSIKTRKSASLPASLPASRPSSALEEVTPLAAPCNPSNFFPVSRPSPRAPSRREIQEGIPRHERRKGELRGKALVRVHRAAPPPSPAAPSGIQGNQGPNSSLRVIGLPAVLRQQRLRMPVEPLPPLPSSRATSRASSSRNHSNPSAPSSRKNSKESVSSVPSLAPPPSRESLLSEREALLPQRRRKWDMK